MGKVMLLMVVALLVLSVSAAMAAPGQADGLAGTPLPGSAGVIGDPFSNWTLTSGAFSNVVMWDIDDSKWVPISGTYPAPNLTMTADVEMRVEESGETSLYWHVFDTGAYVPAGYLHWGLSQNHPCWVGITKESWGSADGAPGGDATVLKWASGYAPPKPEDIAGGDKIPFTVFFSQDGGPEVASVYTEGAGGWGYWSPARVPACDHWGYWKIVLDLKYHQPDGRYELDPILQVVPEL